MGPALNGLLDVAAHVTHPLEAAVIDPVDMPAIHPAHIELAIGGAEPAAVDAGPKVARQWHDRSLWLAIDLVAEHEKVGARSKRKMQKLAAKRTPAIARDIGLAAT